LSDETIARRFVEAFGGRDTEALDGLLAEDVMFYGTLSWGQPWREVLKQFADEFHKGNPKLRVALHDEFYSADGSRGSMRVALHFDNTGPFFGKEPSGKKGVSMETFTIKIRDGRIAELIQGGNTLTLGYVEVVDLGLPYPTDTPDPQPEITSASAGSHTA
jgi:ketosteroid isomerase-like protein